MIVRCWLLVGDQRAVGDLPPEMRRNPDLPDQLPFWTSVPSASQFRKGEWIVVRQGDIFSACEIFVCADVPL